MHHVTVHDTGLYECQLKPEPQDDANAPQAYNKTFNLRVKTGQDGFSSPTLASPSSSTTHSICSTESLHGSNRSPYFELFLCLVALIFCFAFIIMYFVYKTTKLKTELSTMKANANRDTSTMPDEAPIGPSMAYSQRPDPEDNLQYAILDIKSPNVLIPLRDSKGCGISSTTYAAFQ